MPIASNQCNRDDWIAGMWIVSIGITILLSSVFGLVQGSKLYAFAADDDDALRQEI